MKAAVLFSGESRLRIEDVKERSLRPGEIRVNIECCGVCGSDIHVTVHKTMKLKEYPRIMGHEASGIVAEISEGVSKFKVGDRVVISAGTSCGHCKKCDTGRENLCEEVGVLGFDADGAYAQSTIVPERCLVHLPDEIPFDKGAILADAVSTPYHALRFAGRMVEGEEVAITGCGGLGIHAVLLAKALGAARVVACDIDDGALENAKRLGATDVFNTKNEKHLGKFLKEKTGGLDLVLDFSGFYKNIEDGIRVLRPGGRAVMVGLGRGSLEIQMAPYLIYKQITLCGSYGSDSRALPELVALMKSGKLDLSQSITSHHPLEEVNDCLEDLYHRKGNPIRFIIQPQR